MMKIPAFDLSMRLRQVQETHDCGTPLTAFEIPPWVNTEMDIDDVRTRALKFEKPTRPIRRHS